MLDLKIPVLSKWIGFDLEKADWASPNGSGVHEDILLRFQADTVKKYVDFRYTMEMLSVTITLSITRRRIIDMLTNVFAAVSLLSLVPSSWNSNVRVDFRVVDDSCRPVSNAVIRTYTQRDLVASMGHNASPKREIISVTDGEGHAEARFPCYDGQFACIVSSDGFYEERSGDVLFRRARDGIVVEHLLEHEKSLAFTLRPIVDPIPCFGYGAGDCIKFPLKTERFGFDLRKGALVRPYGSGEIADFWVRREETNGIYRAFLEFDGPFNGVYKQKQERSTTFKSTYLADTNRVFVQTMAIWTKARSENGTVRTQYVSDNEYLVIRSRSIVDADGHLKECNYSKIYGPITAFESLRFMTMVFNPKANDTNLEFDREKNLRRRVMGVLLP